MCETCQLIYSIISCTNQIVFKKMCDIQIKKINTNVLVIRLVQLEHVDYHNRLNKHNMNVL